MSERSDKSTPWVTANAIWLVIPPIVLCCVDFGLTLYGQSDRYWAGQYEHVNELSPSFAKYLSIHPLAFVAAALAWIAIFSAVILLLPAVHALFVSVAIVLGHMTGAASWLAYRFQTYQGCNLLFLVTAALLVFALRRGQTSERRSAFNWQRAGLPEPLRWLFIAALIILPIWWFLVPR